MPASQTQYLHIPVSGHSLVSERGHFWQGKFDGFKNRWELNFFSCQRCLVSGYSTIIMIDPWQTITSWKRRAFCNAVFSYERNTLKEIVWGMEYGRLTTINISKNEHFTRKIDKTTHSLYVRCSFWPFGPF